MQNKRINFKSKLKCFARKKPITLSQNAKYLHIKLYYQKPNKCQCLPTKPQLVYADTREIINVNNSEIQEYCWIFPDANVVVTYIEQYMKFIIRELSIDWKMWHGPSSYYAENEPGTHKITECRLIREIAVDHNSKMYYCFFVPPEIVACFNPYKIPTDVRECDYESPYYFILTLL